MCDKYKHIIMFTVHVHEGCTRRCFFFRYMAKLKTNFDEKDLMRMTL